MDAAAIRLNVVVEDGGARQYFDLGPLQCSLGGYSAPVPSDFIAAPGRVRALHGLPDDVHFAGALSLQGSSRVLAHLDCV